MQPSSRNYKTTSKATCSTTQVLLRTNSARGPVLTVSWVVYTGVPFGLGKSCITCTQDSALKQRAFPVGTGTLSVVCLFFVQAPFLNERNSLPETFCLDRQRLQN